MRPIHIKQSVLAWIAGTIVIASCFLVYQTGSAPAHHQTAQTRPTTPSEMHTPVEPVFPIENNNASTAPSLSSFRYSTTDPSSIWIVVNKQHPLNPLSYAPSDLTNVGGQAMRSEAAAALNELFAAGASAGVTLTADSGYRSYSTQVSTYNSVVKAYGQTYADTVSARPGYSEHQTGWTMDIGTNGCHIDNCFAGTPAGQWVAANAYRYGFLLRYPEGLTDTTGYDYESWHYRYIGTSLSQELHSKGIATLEQYFNISGGTTYK